MPTSIPSVRRTSPLGILPAFARDPLGLITDAVRAHGDCVRLPGPPGMQAYLLNEPGLVRAVLVGEAEQVEKPAALKSIMRSSFGDGLFFSEGAFWRRQRRLAQPAFHSQRIQAYADGMVRRAVEMLEAWPDGTVRDLRAEFSASTLRVVVDALFASSVEGETQAIFQALQELGDVIQRQATNPALALLPDWAPLPLLARKRRASAALDAVIYRFIRERRASGEDRGDLLAMLLQAQDDDGQRMTDRQLHDEAMTVFIAGHETTALALTWACVLLSRHPAVEARLRAEVDAAVGKRLPALADLPNLPYTAWVVKETLRLYPPAWLMLRVALANLEVGPYRIPKGQQIWVSPYTLHRRPDYYPEPEAFRPERFAPDEHGQDLEARLPRLAYMPFGGGPRICLGNQFAMLEARLMLAAIVQRARLEPAPGADIRVKAGNLLDFASGALMRLTRRS